MYGVQTMFPKTGIRTRTVTGHILHADGCGYLITHGVGGLIIMEDGGGHPDGAGSGHRAIYGVPRG